MRISGATAGLRGAGVLMGMTAGMLAAVLAALPQQAAASTLEVNDYYVIPDDDHSFNKLAGYVWPEVTELNFLVNVGVDGFAGEEKVELFIAVSDEDGGLVIKDKLKFFLPAGTHDLVFPGFVNTADYFGSRVLTVEFELSLKGAEAYKASLQLNLTGPDPPEVNIVALEVYSYEGGPYATWFRPGEQFIIDALYEIEGNASEAQPVVELFCMMEEDSYILSPESGYSTLDNHRGMLEVEGADGRYRLQAVGFLPFVFAEPYAYEHEFRFILSVDFGRGARTSRTYNGEIYDNHAGEHRYAGELEDRLIELNPPWIWIVQQVPHDYDWEDGRRNRR